MILRRFRFTFPPDTIGEPLIDNLGRGFGLVATVRRADIGKDKGRVLLELQGAPENMERGLAWVSKRGVRVDFIGGDIVGG